jgi:hypothetical protein
LGLEASIKDTGMEGMNWNDDESGVERRKRRYVVNLLQVNPSLQIFREQAIKLSNRPAVFRTSDNLGIISLTSIQAKELY